MIRLRFSACCVTLLFFLGVVMMSSNAQEDNDKSKNTSASSAENKSRIVPQASIVTTSPQKGMKQTRDAFPYKDRASVSTNGYLGQILEATRSGASNVFLIDAKDMHDAVRASSRVLLGSRAAETTVPVDIPKAKRGSQWLVAYLGSGPSEPTWWIVESVTVQGKTLQLNYRKSPPSPATKDIHPYYFWIPLGGLDDGVYELKLYDVKRSVVTLMRRVTVEKETVK